MSTYSLAYYTFKITDKNTIDPKSKRPIILPLGKIKGQKFENLLYKYFKCTAEEYINDAKDERLFRTISFNCNKYYHNKELYYKSVTAIVKTGDYGVEGEMVNSETKKIKKFTDKDAPVHKFGFAIYFNPQKDTAILVTQSIGPKGITTVIKKHLTSFVKKLDINYKIEIKNVIPHDLLKKMLNSEEIKQLKIETYEEKSIDLTDDYGNSTTLQSSQNIKIYKKPVISNKKFFLDLFSKRKKLSTISGLTENEVISDITISFGKKNIKYNNYFNTRITEDITEEINENGFTESFLYELIDKNCLEYLYVNNIIYRVDTYEPIRNCIFRFSVKENPNGGGEIIEQDFTNSF